MLKRTFLVISLTLSGVQISTTVSAGPAIDCTSARQMAELEICRHGFLTALDQKMAEAYGSVHDRLEPFGRRSLQADQKVWEKYRDGCGSQQGCLRALYARRMDELGKLN
jgi:uncharacterized protein